MRKRWYGKPRPPKSQLRAHELFYKQGKEEKKMTANDFQQFVCEKWFGSRDPELESYLVVPTLGIAGEAGEVAEKMKKFFRGDGPLDFGETAIEISDVIFYCAVLAERLDYTLEEILQIQVDKINGRIERGTRRGEGDDR